MTILYRAQKSLEQLTPGRVAQAMGGVFATIGTPAQPPKPRGKSPGWTPGKTRLRKNRFPTVKKTANPPRKEPSIAVANCKHKSSKLLAKAFLKPHSLQIRTFQNHIICILNCKHNFQTANKGFQTILTANKP